MAKFHKVVHTQLDLDGRSLAQAEGGVYRNVLLANLVAIQSQRLQFGEVGHIHSGAETPQSELCGGG